MSAATSPGTGLAYGLPGLRRLGHGPLLVLRHDLRPARRAAAGKASGTEDCVSALTEARNQLVAKGPIELAAEDLRIGVRSLGRITGCVDIEDILDVVFAEFCIGK